MPLDYRLTLPLSTCGDFLREEWQSEVSNLEIDVGNTKLLNPPCHISPDPFNGGGGGGGNRSDAYTGKRLEDWFGMHELVKKMHSPTARATDLPGYNFQNERSNPMLKLYRLYPIAKDIPEEGVIDDPELPSLESIVSSMDLLADHIMHIETVQKKQWSKIADYLDHSGIKSSGVKAVEVNDWKQSFDTLLAKDQNFAKLWNEQSETNYFKESLSKRLGTIMDTLLYRETKYTTGRFMPLFFLFKHPKREEFVAYYMVHKGEIKELLEMGTAGTIMDFVLKTSEELKWGTLFLKKEEVESLVGGTNMAGKKELSEIRDLSHRLVLDRSPFLLFFASKYVRNPDHSFREGDEVLKDILKVRDFADRFSNKDTVYERFVERLIVGEVKDVDELIECLQVHVNNGIITRKLGFGESASVYKLWHKEFKKYFAVKVIDPQGIKAFEEAKRLYGRFSQEFLDRTVVRTTEPSSLVRLVDLENIVRVYYAGDDFVTINGKKRYAILLEYIQGKSIEDLTENDGKPLTAEGIMQCCAGMLRGLFYVFLDKKTYRDLHPGNVLIEDETGRVVIIDLGCANAIETYPPDPNNCRRYGSFDDLFSFGLLVYKMCTSKHPLRDYASSLDKEERDAGEDPVRFDSKLSSSGNADWIAVHKYDILREDGTVREEFRDHIQQRLKEHNRDQFTPLVLQALGAIGYLNERLAHDNQLTIAEMKQGKKVSYEVILPIKERLFQELGALGAS